MMKITKKHAGRILSIACMSLVLMFLFNFSELKCFTKSVHADSADSTSKGINVAYHTQDEIRTYIANNGATINDALKFSENPATTKPYSLGKLSDKTLHSALAMLNQVRYIAGISDQVQLDNSYNQLAQAASLANYLNDTLSHEPEKPAGMSDDMYNMALKGASSSNISYASWSGQSLNDVLISGFMCDSDKYNISRVGHRRWVLNPSMKSTGFGAVSGKNGTYSALYSFDRNNSTAGEYGVAWPAQNMPVEYFGADYAWSVSMGYKVDASKIKVTLTRKNDGKKWEFSQGKSDGVFYVDNDYYGQIGCIIFRPSSVKKYNADDGFQVDITGLEQGDVSYTVHFFQALDHKSSATKPSSDPAETKQNKAKTPKLGSKIKDAKNIYIVTGITSKSKTVKYKKPRNSKNASAVIPKTIKINGNVYKVTEISANAFKNCKRLKKVTIGKNITKIGKNAFLNCKSLRHMNIQSSKLTNKNVGKNAFKGISRKVVVKTPAKKYKEYKVLLRKHGVASTARIKHN